MVDVDDVSVYPEVQGIPKFFLKICVFEIILIRRYANNATHFPQGPGVPEIELVKIEAVPPDIKWGRKARDP
jgi:hypothetical protein